MGSQWVRQSDARQQDTASPQDTTFSFQPSTKRQALPRKRCLSGFAVLLWLRLQPCGSLTSRSVRRLGVLGEVPEDASGAASTAVCVAYVPSASTAGRRTTGAGAAAAAGTAAAPDSPPSAQAQRGRGGAQMRVCPWESHDFNSVAAAHTGAKNLLTNPSSARHFLALPGPPGHLSELTSGSHPDRLSPSGA